MKKFLNAIGIQITEDAPKGDGKAAPQVAQAQPTVVAPTFGAYEESIAKALAAAVEAANLPGIDYLEFKQALNASSGLAVPEDVKFKMVFSTLAAGGLKKEVLTNAIDHYLKVLDGEVNKFNQATQQAFDGKVTAKEKQISALNDDNQKLAEQIKQITEKIKSNQEQCATLTSELEQDKIKLSNAKANFDKTMTVFVENLNADKVKIQTLL
jgi:predicted RNase H-like nuclease (RuvC/YqgF family)